MSFSYVTRKLYYGEETSYGTAAAMSKTLGLATSWNAGGEQVAADIRVGERTLRDRVILGLDFSPSVEFMPLTGEFLKYVLGNVTNSGTTAPYTHTITPGQSLKSLTVEVAKIGSAARAERSVGTLVESCEISVEADGLMTVSLDMRAKQVSVLDSYTDPNISIPGKQPFKFTDMTFTVGGTPYTAIITSASISVENTLEPGPRSGDFISKYYLGAVEAEAEVELFFEDNTVANYMLNKTRADAVIRLARAADDYIEFTLPNARFDWEGEVDFGGDPLVQTLRIYPTSISVEVKDDIAAY
ncbi:MAG: phage tail tube protein [Candidatus Caldarchaeum sp.]